MLVRAAGDAGLGLRHVGHDRVELRVDEVVAEQLDEPAAAVVVELQRDPSTSWIGPRSAYFGSGTFIVCPAFHPKICAVFIPIGERESHGCRLELGRNTPHGRETGRPFSLGGWDALRMVDRPNPRTRGFVRAGEVFPRGVAES